jgi:hypothetical protein
LIPTCSRVAVRETRVPLRGPQVSLTKEDLIPDLPADSAISAGSQPAGFPDRCTSQDGGNGGMT